MSSSEEDCDVDWEAELKNLETPFNWNMTSISETVDKQSEDMGEDEDVLFVKIINNIMTIFAYLVDKINQSDSIEEILDIPEATKSLVLFKLNVCDELFNSIVQEEIDTDIGSTKTVKHILEGTKAHVYWYLNLKKEAKWIINKIKNTSLVADFERSTLIGCKGMAWSKYFKFGARQAIPFIKEALKLDPENHLWNFMLGKNLRRVRREKNGYFKPSKEEMDCFLKAYRLYRDERYGVFLAQMYREVGDYTEANKVYTEVYSSNLDLKYSTHLRLALGYIRLGKLQLAKNCLDCAEKKFPKDSMYLHYKGIYYLKIRDLEKALQFFKKASELHNFPATLDYIRYMTINKKPFNQIRLLQEVLEKHNTLSENERQSVKIELALKVGEKNKVDSLKYFVDGIEINPDSKTITEHQSFVDSRTVQNVYETIKNKVLFCIDETTLVPADKQLFLKLNNYCDLHLKSVSKNSYSC